MVPGLVSRLAPASISGAAGLADSLGLAGNQVFAVWLNLAVSGSYPGSGPHRQVHGDLAGLFHPCLIQAGRLKILLLIPIVQ